MPTPKVFDSEFRLCLLVWNHEPLRGGELVKLCEQHFNWRPTTTYTVLKRLCDRGILKKDKLIVTSLISKEEMQTEEINRMIETRFEGSVPAFFAAILKHRKISDEDINIVQNLLDQCKVSLYFN